MCELSEFHRVGLVLTKSDFVPFLVPSQSSQIFVLSG